MSNSLPAERVLQVFSLNRR